MKPKSPCSPNCDGRSGICHSICEAWKEYEKARNEFYEDSYARKESVKRTYPAKVAQKRRGGGR